MAPVLGYRIGKTGGCRRDHVRWPGAALVAGSALGLAARKAYRLLTSGALTLDLSVGRRLQPFGPLVQPIRAPQEVVFANGVRIARCSQRLAARVA